MDIEKLTKQRIEEMKVGTVYVLREVTSDVLNSTRSLIAKYKADAMMDGGEFDYTTDIDREARVLTVKRTR